MSVRRERERAGLRAVRGRRSEKAIARSREATAARAAHGAVRGAREARDQFRAGLEAEAAQLLQLARDRLRPLGLRDPARLRVAAAATKALHDVGNSLRAIDGLPPLTLEHAVCPAGLGAGLAGLTLAQLLGVRMGASTDQQQQRETADPTAPTSQDARQASPADGPAAAAQPVDPMDVLPVPPEDRPPVGLDPA